MALDQPVTDAEGLRRQIERTLSRAAGPDRDVGIAGLRFRLGAEGLVSVEASGITVTDRARADRISIGEAFLELRLLPLLAGRAEARSLVVRDTAIDVTPLLKRKGGDPFKLLAAIDLDAALRAVGERLFAAERTLRRTGLETIALSNVRLAGFQQAGLRSRSAMVRELRLTRDERFTEGLRVEGLVELERSAIRLSGDWESENASRGSRTLRLDMDGLDLAELPHHRPGSKTPLALAAPLRMTARLPFGADGTPEPAFLNLDVGAGSGLFADRETTALRFARIRLRATPALNSVALLPSPFATASASGTLSGGAARSRFHRTAG